MRELTLEEIGVNLDRVIRLLGGPEKVLQHIDEEQAMIFLVRKLGKEKARQMVEQISRGETTSAKNN